MKRLVQQLEIVGRCLLGQLDDHVVRGNAIGVQQLERAPGLVGRVK